MKSIRYHSLFPQEEEVFGRYRPASRESKIYSNLGPASKNKGLKIPREVRDSFSKGAASLGLVVFLVPAAATARAANTTAVGDIQPTAGVAAFKATASKGQLTAMTEFKLNTSTSSYTDLPSSDVASRSRSVETEQFFEVGEFDRLVTLLKGLPIQPDDTDDFDPDPII